MHLEISQLRDKIARRSSVKRFLLIGIVVSCAYAGASKSASAQTPDDLLQQANSGVCPGDLATYRPINSNDICDPGGSVTRACDANYRAPSRAWQACYDETFACRRRVDAENKKIYAYNSFIYKCRTAFSRAGGRAKWATNVRVNLPGSLVTPVVVQPAAPPPPAPPPQQTQPLNPYNPDPMVWGLQAPDPGGDPDYGGVSIGVDPKASQDNSGLGGIVGKVKKLATP